MSSSTLAGLLGAGAKKLFSKKKEAATPPAAACPGAAPATPVAYPENYRKGGLVKRSGMAKVHSGERVLTKQQVKRYGRKG